MGGDAILGGCGHCGPRTVQAVPCPDHRRTCLVLSCGTCGTLVRHAEAAA